MDIDELPRRIAAGKPIASLNVRDDRWPEVDCDGAVFTDCVFEAVQFSYPAFVDARFSNGRFVACPASSVMPSLAKARQVVSDESLTREPRRPARAA